jgi:hypothetical protein
MRRPDYLHQVKQRLQNANPGTVFIPSDFFEIAEAVTINKCLERLTKTGQLTRIIRGVYAKPRFSELLNKEVPPRMDDIAKAIARNYGWTIVPCGDTALNMLGLSTQVTATWTYVSDGPYKTYNVNGMTLKFKHTDNKNELNHLFHRAALVIQALKALGKNNVTEKELRAISKMLSDDEKIHLVNEGKRVTAWVYKLIRIIGKESSNG